MNSLKKNDRVCVNITDYTDDGLGVGKAQTPDSTFTLFVKDTALGDRAEVLITKVNKSYGYARVVNLITASPDRVDPVCPVAKSCGGCTLRHISYKSQLLWKEKRVADCLSRIGGLRPKEDFKLSPIIGMEKPERYRNKAQYPVGLKDSLPVTGFYAGRTHSVVASDDCLIEPEIFKSILKSFRDFLRLNEISVYDEQSGRGLVRHVLLREGRETNEIMVCVVVNATAGEETKEKFSDFARRLAAFTQVKTFLLSHNTARTNVILGDKETLIFGDGKIKDKIGTKVYEISARSFYQVNPIQTKVLYEKAAEFAALTGEEVVWDLYCGTGTIALYLSGGAKAVYGVELSESAVRNAKANAILNDIQNAEFVCGKAEDVGIKIKELPPPDVIVVDPPRKGCDERLINTIIKSAAGRLVYVSCNPATFARDAALLKEGGYILTKVQPVDMFPHTTGVECVGSFNKL